VRLKLWALKGGGSQGPEYYKLLITGMSEIATSQIKKLINYRKIICSSLRRSKGA